jgi:hypothetical protein
LRRSNNLLLLPPPLLFPVGAVKANNAVASSSTSTTPVKSNSSSTSSVAAPALQRCWLQGNDTPSKPILALVTSPLPLGILGQGTHPVQQPNLSRPSHLPSPTPINPQQPNPYLAKMMYPHGPVGMICPSAMSLRVGNFTPISRFWIFSIGCR